jgi:hypothetical protein
MAELRPDAEARRSVAGTELSNEAAKMIVYEAFIEGELDVPRHLARRVREFCFNPR